MVHLKLIWVWYEVFKSLNLVLDSLGLYGTDYIIEVLYLDITYSLNPPGTIKYSQNFGLVMFDVAYN